MRDDSPIWSEDALDPLLAGSGKVGRGKGATAMVQVVCLTIDGKKVVCIGPVLHVPPLDIYVGEVEEIEFGELMPAALAAELLSGEFVRGIAQ